MNLGNAPRFLMCPPRHFGVTYAINPWMDPESWSRRGTMERAFPYAKNFKLPDLNVLAMIEANYGHVDRFTRVQVSLAAGKERPQREHYRLLEACREADIDGAVRLLEGHIVQTQKSLMAAARRRPAGRDGR